MVFDHLVKHNGIWYKAGEDVPITSAPTDTMSAKENKIEAETLQIAPKKVAGHTKAEINTMRVKDLRDLADELGLLNNDEKSGAMLKIEIIKKLGL